MEDLYNLSQGIYLCGVEDTTYLPYRWGTLNIFQTGGDYGCVTFYTTVGTSFFRTFSRSNTNHWYTDWVSFATKSDFYTINSGLIHANPGIVNHTILHENVGGRGVSNRFITINRGNLEAPEQITVSIDPNGVSETQTPVTIRNNGSSTRDISINLLIIYR